MAPLSLVSTIIPTHNRAALLQKALDSAYSQQGVGELFDQEIIVVDDASIDATAEVVRRHPQVRYIRLAPPRRKLPRGASAALNAGIAVSRGTFVAFLHDDDTWFPHRLKVQVSTLERHPDAGAVYSQEIDPSSGRQGPDLSRGASGWIFQALLEKGDFVPVSTILIRRHALDRVGYFDVGLATSEDWDLWLRLSYHFSIVFLPSVVSAHSESPAGMMLTRAANGSAADDIACVVRKALHMGRELDLSAELKQRAWAHVRWPRAHVVHTACSLALAAHSPRSAVRDFCAALMASPGENLRQRWMLRQTVADIWVEVARALASRNGKSKQTPIYEAVCAVVRAPSIGRLTALLRIAGT
ncbi:MAG TPA: glycosyltransferase family A protein [bacterium]|nr:glycosyltransferase family A protein [bacterium]